MENETQNVQAPAEVPQSQLELDFWPPHSPPLEDDQPEPRPSGMDRRLQALAAARDHVEQMLAEKNSKGYDRHSASAEKRLEMELEVAAFLLGEER